MGGNHFPNENRRYYERRRWRHAGRLTDDGLTAGRVFGFVHLYTHECNTRTAIIVA